MARVYEHVTPETKKRILDALQARWEASLPALRRRERERFIALLPKMQKTIEEITVRQQAEAEEGAKIIAQISPRKA